MRHCLDVYSLHSTNNYTDYDIVIFGEAHDEAFKSRPSMPRVYLPAFLPKIGCPSMAVKTHAACWAGIWLPGRFTSLGSTYKCVSVLVFVLARCAQCGSCNGELDVSLLGDHNGHRSGRIVEGVLEALFERRLVHKDPLDLGGKVCTQVILYIIIVL